MAIRRPKKLARNGPARTAGSLRVGPSMETLELTFTPTHVGRQTKSNRDTDKGLLEGEKTLLSWNIRWEVDVGATIDEGSRLARVFRGGGKHDEHWCEHVIRAPREGILTEVLVRSGEEVLSQSISSPALSPGSLREVHKDRIPGANSQDTATTQDTTTSEDTESLSQDASVSSQPARESFRLYSQGPGRRSMLGRDSSAGDIAKAESSVVIGRLSFCTHPELHGTLCTTCGRNVVGGSVKSHDGKRGARESGQSRQGPGGASSGARDGRMEQWLGEINSMSKVTMKGGGTLTLSSIEKLILYIPLELMSEFLELVAAAKKMHMDKSGRLLSSRRLALVLDLDNTLLHCTDHPDAGRMDAPGIEGVYTIRLPNQPRDYFVKLRPGLRSFLAKAVTMFEMTIYTAGTSDYADAVARVLDPDRNLFQGRHFSTCYTPDLGRNTKSIERIFPCGLDMALIVDDRDDVWRGEQANNLLLVRPYKFFVGQKSVPSGPTHSVFPQPPTRASPSAVSLSPGVRHPTNPSQPPSTSPPRDMGPHAGGGNNNAPADKVRPDGLGAREEADADADSDTDVSTKVTAWQDNGPHAAGKGVEQVNIGRLAIENGHEGHGGRRGGVGSDREQVSKTGADVDAGTVSARSREAEEGNGKPPGGVPGEGRRADTGTMVSPAPQGASSSTKPMPATSGLSEAIGKLGRDLAEVLAQRRKQAAMHGCEEMKATEGGSAIMAAELTSASGAEKVVPPSLSSVESSKEKVENEQRNQRDIRRSEDEGSKEQRSSEPARAPAGGHVPGEPKAETKVEPVPADVGSFPEKSDGSQGVRGGSATATEEVVRVSEGTKSTRVSDVEKEGQASGFAASSRVPGRAVPRGDVATAGSSASAVENDPQLECTLRTLETVHAKYFSVNENDVERRVVAKVLAEVRSGVLRGVRMVFSGVIPVAGVALDPRTHRLWRLAEVHGARVDSAIGPSTTHVVAMRLGTAKTNAGLRMPGVFVVHLDWLMNSVWHCRREQETLFLLAGQVCGRVPQASGLPPARPPPESYPTSGASVKSMRGGRGNDRTSITSSGGAEGRDERGGVDDSSEGTTDGNESSAQDQRRSDFGEARSLKRRRDQERGVGDDDRDGVSNGARCRRRVDGDSSSSSGISSSCSSSGDSRGNERGSVRISTVAGGDMGEECDRGDRAGERSESSGSGRSLSGSCSSSASSNDDGSTESDLMDLVNELDGSP